MKDQLKYIAHLSLGSNVGNRAENLNNAIDLLEKHDIHVIQRSSVYETAPWGETRQNSFLNQVLLVKSKWNHQELFIEIKNIEIACGRKTTYKWGPREMDIDLLFFGRLILQSSHLIIPHPELQNRKFILEPLTEVTPEWMHPLLLKTVSELLHICTDNSKVEIWASKD